MSEIITGIDIGSNNVICSIGKIENSDINIIGYSKVPCEGLRYGVVVNIENTVSAIREAVESAEKKAGEVVRTAYVGIKGNHIQHFENHGATAISGSDREITIEDIRQVIESAKAIRVPPGSEIIHVIPQEFSVDDQKGVIAPPIGMEAKHLGVNVYIVTGSITAISNIVKCINRAGVEVNEVVLSIIANSKVVLSNEERQLGTVLIDFGGQTVDIAVFIDGNIKIIRELQIGGEFITRDIAHFFRISLSEAERIKENYGVAMKKYITEDEEIEVLGIDKRRKFVIKRSILADVIEQRLIEIFTKVKRILETNGLKDLIPAGLVFTGGSSLLTGLIDMSEEFFWGFPARLGYPQDIKGDDEIMTSPVYTTSCGLIKYALKSDIPQLGGSPTVRTIRKPPFSKLFSWIKRMF